MQTCTTRRGERCESGRVQRNRRRAGAGREGGEGREVGGWGLGRRGLLRKEDGCSGAETRARVRVAMKLESSRVATLLALPRRGPVTALTADPTRLRHARSRGRFVKTRQHGGFPCPSIAAAGNALSNSTAPSDLHLETSTPPVDLPLEGRGLCLGIRSGFGSEPGSFFHRT